MNPSDLVILYKQDQSKNIAKFISKNINVFSTVSEFLLLDKKLILEILSLCDKLEPEFVISLYNNISKYNNINIKELLSSVNTDKNDVLKKMEFVKSGTEITNNAHIDGCERRIDKIEQLLIEYSRSLHNLTGRIAALEKNNEHSRSKNFSGDYSRGNRGEYDEVLLKLEDHNRKIKKLQDIISNELLIDFNTNPVYRNDPVSSPTSKNVTFATYTFPNSMNPSPVNNGSYYGTGVHTFASSRSSSSEPIPKRRHSSLPNSFRTEERPRSIFKNSKNNYLNKYDEEDSLLDSSFDTSPIKKPNKRVRFDEDVLNRESSSHVNKPDNFTEDAYKCCQDGDVESLRYLINNGTKVNQKDVYGDTLLHYASTNGHYRVCELLIQNKASLNEKDNWIYYV